MRFVSQGMISGAGKTWPRSQNAAWRSKPWLRARGREGHQRGPACTVGGSAIVSHIAWSGHRGLNVVSKNSANQRKIWMESQVANSRAVLRLQCFTQVSRQSFRGKRLRSSWICKSSNRPKAGLARPSAPEPRGLGPGGSRPPLRCTPCPLGGPAGALGRALRNAVLEEVACPAGVHEETRSVMHSLVH